MMTQPRRRANEGISAVVKQRSMQRHARHLSSTTSSESSGRRTARDIPRGAVPPLCSGRLTARRGDPTYLVEQRVARLPADAGRARLGRVTTAEESSVGRGEKNYVDALATFKGWAKREGRSVHVKDLALTLLDFIDALLEAKRPVHEADMVVAAVRARYPSVLVSNSEVQQRVRRALRGFGKKRPRRSRLPIPETVMAGIVAAMLHRKARSSALETVTRFYLALRPGESRRIRAGHLAPPPKAAHLDPGLQYHTITIAPQEELDPTKTQCFDDTLFLDHPSWLGAVLDRHVQSRAVDDPMFLETDAQLLKHWHRALADLRLKKVVPYQLRHGGASAALLNKRKDRQGVQDHLRHAAVQSTRNYAQAGQIQRMLKGLEPATLDYCTHARIHLQKIVKGTRLPGCPPFHDA